MNNELKLTFHIQAVNLWLLLLLYHGSKAGSQILIKFVISPEIRISTESYDKTRSFTAAWINGMHGVF